MSNTATATTKVITGVVRGSYVNVFQPRANELSGKNEYSMMLLIPKSDKATMARLNAAIEVAKEKKWGVKIPNGLKITLRDGDAEFPNDATYAGNYFVNVKSDTKPGVVDRDLQPIIDATEFVSGDYCKASLNAYGFDTKGNKGVSFGLNNLQVWEKGEPLGNRSRAEDDFSAAGDEDF